MSEGVTLIPVQIVIGRNTVDGYPLSAAAWGRFQARIIHALATVGEFYRVILGTGIDITGKAEENATFLGTWPDGSKMLLKEQLKNLQEEYEQAAILLIWGELEVIA